MTVDQTSARHTYAPHLPFLRRYARAISGSQKAGDAYVRAALEALLADPGGLDTNPSNPRLELFRLFHLFRSPVLQPSGIAEPEGAALHGREGLMLTAIEGFTSSEAASILNISATEMEAAIADMKARIAAAIRSRVLIIEDEPIIAMHLEQIVADMGHETVANAITREEAVQEAGRTLPDLVLADIQLADGSSGVDAVGDILARQDVPVIFITAYPERLLTGERPEPTYLVTKPFQAEAVVATIGQALLARQPLFAPA
ncbi:response regulator [Sandaracinobacter sp. RS1-74]|uniref:response regulator n=1 Tax=Sandaracinobacteroides sayramensis TaxID=2913411 RepID=UPI001EDB88BA|nr:response regulator [Sandaracinobacteroides sayramensis]MCG2839725.1 response regulator [Sandaracinobacteroides sayramensis]